MSYLLNQFLPISACLSKPVSKFRSHIGDMEMMIVTLKMLYLMMVVSAVLGTAGVVDAVIA